MPKVTGPEARRAMIYAATALVHFYRGDYVPYTPGEKLGTILDRNQPLAERMRQDLKQHFGYEITDADLATAMEVYGMEPASLEESGPLVPMAA